VAALLACASGALAAARPASAAGCANANLRPTAADEPAVSTATLCLIDRVRAAHHLRWLRANRELRAVALSQVSAMVRWDYFADIRPSGQTPLSLVQGTRYPFHTLSFAVGQNIAWGAHGGETPASIVAAWMASPPHRALILDGRYRDAGVAVAPAVPTVLGRGPAGATYAMEFGTRVR
jgi:uncharacterized protein YkwD